MDQMLLTLNATGQSWFGVIWPAIWTLIKIVLIVAAASWAASPT